MRLKRRKRRKKCKRKEGAENNGKYKIQGSKYKEEKSGKNEENKIRVLWKLIKREKGRKFRTDKRENCTCGYRDGRNKKLKQGAKSPLVKQNTGRGAKLKVNFISLGPSSNYAPPSDVMPELHLSRSLTLCWASANAGCALFADIKTV